MPTLTIVRGLPGTGKTTYARSIAAKRGCLFVEPDMFEVADYGYHYSPDSHHEAMNMVLAAVYMAGERAADLVVADVLPCRMDVHSIGDAYKEAFERGYAAGTSVPGPGPGGRIHDDALARRRRQGAFVSVISLGRLDVDASVALNVHNVPRREIKTMADAWEPVEGEHILNIIMPKEGE